FQVSCLAMHACDNQTSWGNGWIKNVFDYETRAAQARQAGKPPENFLSPPLDTALNFIPNFTIPGLSPIQTGDLGALYQGVFRHFIYELWPAFQANACDLHDTAPDGMLKHDHLFNDAVIPCFDEMVDQGLISPLAGFIAKNAVPAAAAW